MSLRTHIQTHLKALGKRSLPDSIEVHNKRYVLRRIFKNDFFAVTACYESESSKVILKVNRQAGFLGFPLHWVGRWLASRECTALERLKEVDGVPNLLARWQRTGLVRQYIEGEPLARGQRVPDGFHENLRNLIEKIHQKQMAYVDLEKCENVLVGDDGRPYLFDFQIAWYLPVRWGGQLWPARLVRRWLQEGDRYHLLKLHRRTRPDQLSPQTIATSYRRPWYVHVHHWVTSPFTWCRRQILNRIDPPRAAGERGAVPDGEGIKLPLQRG